MVRTRVRQICAPKSNLKKLARTAIGKIRAWIKVVWKNWYGQLWDESVHGQKYPGKIGTDSWWMNPCAEKWSKKLDPVVEQV